MTNSSFDPTMNPESFATFVFLAEGEVCGFMQLPLMSEAMVAGLRSGNVSVVEIPTGTTIPAVLSTWDGTNFIPPNSETGE
jgi:hypothetical protein